MPGIGTLLALGSVLGQTFGQIKSGQEANKQQKYLDKRRDDLNTLFNEQYNTPYLQTEEAQSALGALRTNIDKYQKRALGRAAVTGASDEAKIAANQGANEAMASAASDISGQGTGYKEGLRRENVAQNLSLDQEQNALNAAQRQKWTNYMSNAGNLLTAGLVGESMGAWDTEDNAIKDSWNNRAGISGAPISKILERMTSRKSGSDPAGVVKRKVFSGLFD